MQHWEHLQRARRRLNTMDAGCFCVPGAALGPQSHFAWQAQHSEHLTVILCGRCSTWRTSVSFCLTGAALGAPPERSAKVRQRLTTVDAGCFCRGTWRTSVSFCVAGAALGAPPESPTIEYYGRRLLLRARCITWRTSVAFCTAGAALGAPPERSAEVRRR